MRNCEYFFLLSATGFLLKMYNIDQNPNVGHPFRCLIRSTDNVNTWIPTQNYIWLMSLYILPIFTIEIIIKIWHETYWRRQNVLLTISKPIRLVIIFLLVINKFTLWNTKYHISLQDFHIILSTFFLYDIICYIHLVLWYNCNVYEI